MSIAQILFLIVEFFLVLGVIVYLHANTISLLRGAPYVGTDPKLIAPMLSKINLKPGTKFLELGCGDGRVVCEAVQKYGVIGRGVDVSSLWLWFARIRTRKLGIASKVTFLHQNMWETDLAWADVMYLYLMPRLVEEYGTLIDRQAKKGTVVISHSFSISSLEKRKSGIIQIGKTHLHLYLL